MSGCTTRPVLTPAVLLAVGRAVDVGRCWRLLDSAWFDLGDDRRLSIRPDDAGRFRVDIWNGSKCCGSVWIAAGDWLRLHRGIMEILGEHALA